MACAARVLAPNAGTTQSTDDSTAATPDASRAPIAFRFASAEADSDFATFEISPAIARATAPPSRAVLRPIRSLAWMPVVPS